MAQKRHRYPTFGIREAIDGVEKIFNAEHRSSMPPEVAVSHLGYTSLNGASMKSLAALKKYGLLEGRGDNLAVTNDAVTIIADKNVEDQTERAAALQRALISDPLFEELSQKFGDRGSQINITAYLTKKGFMTDAARKATESYLDSVAFVKEQIGDYNFSCPPQPAAEEIKQIMNQQLISEHERSINSARHGFSQAVNTSTNLREISIPLPGVAWPVLKIELPMSSATWDQMLTMLDAMKPALVSDVKPQLPEDTNSQDEEGQELA